MNAPRNRKSLTDDVQLIRTGANHYSSEYWAVLAIPLVISGLCFVRYWHQPSTGSARTLQIGMLLPALVLAAVYAATK